MNENLEARFAALEARLAAAESELEAARQVLPNIMAALQRAHECETVTAEAVVLHRRALEALGVSFQKREPPQASGSVQ